ncbi:MAG: hypothetical protein ACO3RK_05185, partial [Luteolibacter sp.]
WLRTAIDDAVKRASSTFGIELELAANLPIADALVAWASKNKIQQIAAMRPEIGPLNDQLNKITSALSNAGIDLALFDRLEDLTLRPLATGGFFNFWEKMQKLMDLSTKNAP